MYRDRKEKWKNLDAVIVTVKHVLKKEEIGHLEKSWEEGTSPMNLFIYIAICVIERVSEQEWKTIVESLVPLMLISTKIKVKINERSAV